MIYIVMSAIILVLCVWMAKRILYHPKPHQDSALKQRAVFSLNQQLIYQRIQQIMPDHVVLAHVSFDSLLTTKYPRTRTKYRNMTADFVILNQQNQVLAIIGFDEVYVAKKQINAEYEDDLLRLAGYKVIRYFHVPPLEQLLIDLTDLPQIYPMLDELKSAFKKYHSFYPYLTKTESRISLV